jgi:hypothetical protein
MIPMGHTAQRGTRPNSETAWTTLTTRARPTGHNSDLPSRCGREHVAWWCVRERTPSRRDRPRPRNLGGYGEEDGAFNAPNVDATRKLAHVPSLTPWTQTLAIWAPPIVLASTRRIPHHLINATCKVNFILTYSLSFQWAPQNCSLFRLSPTISSKSHPLFPSSISTSFSIPNFTPTTSSISILYTPQSYFLFISSPPPPHACILDSRAPASDERSAGV